MNRQLKLKLKDTLVNMREDIHSKVAHIEKENLGRSQKESTGDLSGYSLHMADLASDNYERELSLGLAESERELLHKIDDALKRSKDKNFGKCEECKKEITQKRLTAVPYALLCIACQEQEDKKLRQS